MINLNEQFAKQLQTRFVAESVVAGKLSDEYSFSGARTVKVLTPTTVDMVDYEKSGSSRYGTPAEMQDAVQELTLTQDKAFTMTVDKANFDDGMFLKGAVKMLALQISEKAIPVMDAYVLGRLAQGAGKVVGSSTAPSASNICSLISEATRYLDDAEVPNNDRTLFLSAEGYALLKHSDEFLAVESLAREALRRGVVGRYDNMEVVKVPAARWPKHVNFMIVHKYAAVAPVKISDSQIHENPPGISGSLIEGRQYYDCFVYGVKCDGVYVHVNTASGKGTVVAEPSITAAGGAISCATSGATVKYTTDGSDPRYSPTAKTGTQSDVTASGTVVRAYAFKDAEGFYPSAVVKATLS
ncbi:MAG: chitobiase/beta-hexosaminidase C-terminal domain-containing protein [Oscillospiraceae bacterium]|nr:chitobiase/beta-hexosaminidase C-terminal domain-containing protein [Oscillospiraceae bacterium]